MGDELATAETEAETASETDAAASPRPLPLPEGAQPVDGVTGYHALIKSSAPVVTVFGPDGAEIASADRRGVGGDALVGRVGDTRLVSIGLGDKRLTSFAELAARHHRAVADPGVRDRVWVRWEADGVAAVYGTDKHDAADRRAVKFGNLYWSGQRQGWATGRKWNPGTRDRNLAEVLAAFARQDRNIVVLGPGQTPEDLVASPSAAAAVPAQQAPPAAAPSVTAPEPELAPEPEPEPEPAPEPEDLTVLSDEELLAAEDAAATARRQYRYSSAEPRVTEAEYQRLRQEIARRVVDREATAAPVTELTDEDLAAEREWWKKTIDKTPFHSSDERYRKLERRRDAVTAEQNGRTARALMAGPAAADLDDEALESAYEQIGPAWTRLPGDNELRDQVNAYRTSLHDERIARRARSYSERTPVGEMTLEELIAESADLESHLSAHNEQSAYSYSEAVKDARAKRLRAVDAEWHQRGLEQHPDAARAALGRSVGGRLPVLIDGSERSYGYMERRGKKFRALANFDQRSSIGDFDSGPAAMAALVRRYDQDPGTLPRRTWGTEREVDLPISSYDPLVSWLRRRPGEPSREFARVLEILSPYELPTQTKKINPLTNKVMRAYPFHFEEGLLGELARIAERTTEDLREQSLNEQLPKQEREAAKRRIPAMGAALIGINAVIEQVRAAGGDVERRGVDQGRLAAQMAALAGTVDEREEGENDDGEQPVRDAAAAALGGVPAPGAGGDGGPGPVLPDAGDADGRGDRGGGGGPGGGPGAGDGVPGPGWADGADLGDGAGAGPARDAAAAGGRGGPGGAAESGSGGAGGDPQGAGEPVATRRFRPDPADLPRGPLARAEANLEALKVLRTLERENRGTTVDEARTLARWSGWGSVPAVFLDEPDPDEPIYAPGGDREGGFETDHAAWESYSRVRGELRDLLDPFEWRAASRAVLSAHYTPQAVAETMWQGLAAYGFDGGEVLEAGCGSGAFFGVAPAAARLTGVELDPTTAAIAGRIYPHANVLAESFTDTDAPLGTFDAVIGNVPFAQAPFGERRYRAGGHSLHNGFIIKQLALLRPGAYMAVITSRWTLDGEDTAARRDMSRWGDLAAAYRLPKGTFGETADTDVVADVLVFRRRAEGEEPRDQSWIEAPERELSGNTVTVNAYFTEHPENVLGRLTTETGPYGPRVTVQGDPGEAPRLLRERMEATAAAAVADGLGYVPHEDWPHREPLLLQTARLKHATDFTGRLYTDDQARIWQHVNGADPVRVITADGVAGTEQLRMLLSLRDVAGELQELDRTGHDPDRAREIRDQLARLHAAYTKKHGPLSRPRQTRLALPSDEAVAAARAAGVDLNSEDRLPTGWGWFRQDPHAAVVLGLEHWDRANDRAVPSEVLTRRPGTRRGDLEPTDDPKTALTAVLGATGRVDLPLIASLLGTTAEEARLRLGTEVFDNPVTKKLEHAGAYLSGAVRQKLEQARQAAVTDPKYAVNVAALEAVQPPAKRLGQFTAQLGAHWIPAPLVQGFLREYLGDPTLQVSHNERYGWSLAAGKVSDAINALKGTERRSAVHIAKALLGKASMVVNQLDGSGVDEDATRAMRYKADAMRSAFEEYCTASTARVTQLTDAYNRQMNGHVVRNYDGLAPTLEGFTTERTPHPWQLSGAARMQYERGVILAHEMGLGKTTTMVMGSQALKASGQISKPFAVVQPGLGRQWLDEAKLLYPNADIRLITSDDLADGNRRPVLEWLRANTPDLVIFTEGAFQSIRMSPEQQELYVFRELESLKEQLERERGVPHNAFALMKLEQRLATVEARIRRNDAPMRTPGEVYWDDLGFDYACIDEAHRFTAVGFRSKEAGGESASVRAVDLHQKLSWHHRMAEYDGGRPTVTLGTGTPMENSIFEQYSCLELATPWLLDQFGVHGPDLWAETFGQKVQRIEQAPDGSGLTIVERFSRFVSKATMKTMWGLATDTKTADEVGIERPRIAGGAPQLVLVEPTADQRARLQSLVVRGQAIHAGDVTRDEDNMLAVTGEGRAVALDPRLVDANAPAGNKLVQAADIIAAGYHAHKDHTYAVSSRDDTPHGVPGGLFFVFCNSGTPDGENKGDFKLYAELRDLLAARGVPRDMVQFAQEHRTPERKAEMTRAANNGGIAVLMGSSEVLGTGFNGQNRAYALMHLDQDWTPAMMMQRNARALRPGNQHEEVSIYFLATKGSMDAWQVGLLTSKAEGLRDIQRPPGVGDDDGDTVEEIGESDWDYATMAAEIGGNPYMRQFMEARLHLQGLEADRRNAAADRVRQTELLGIKEGELAGTRLAITAREKALPKITETIRGDAFRIRIGGREFDRFGEAAPVLRQVVTEAVRAHQNEGIGPWKKLGTFGGLDFAVRPEVAHGSGEVRAYIGFPELRHSESRCSVEDLVKSNIGATMLGRLATALEKAEDHQLMDRERLPGLEKEVAELKAQQEAVNYGPAIEHARRRVELLDGIVGAITERDKVPELTESMLDPKKYPTENGRKKALQENAEKRAPLQANVDAAAARLAAFDAENPAPEPVVLVNPWTEDNDTDEAVEQWRERQRIIVQQNREAGVGAPITADESAPAPEDGADDAAAAEPVGERTEGQAPAPEPGGDSTEEPATETTEPPGDGYGTADLYDEFGLTQPTRVPAPVPQDEPDPETETEESAGVPDGQMTVDEAQAPPERDTEAGDERGHAAAEERRDADLDAAAVLRHYEPLLAVVGLSGADAVSYLTGERVLEHAGQPASEDPFDRLLEDIARRADRVGGISQRGREITIRNVSEDRVTLRRHLTALALGVDDVRRQEPEPYGIDLAGILAAPGSRFTLPDTPQWRLAAAVPTGKVVVAHDPQTGYAVFNTYRRRKAGEVLRAQGFRWDPSAVPEGVWRPRADHSEDEQHQAVRRLLDALTGEGIAYAVHGQMPGHSAEPAPERPLAPGPADAAEASDEQTNGEEAQPEAASAKPEATAKPDHGRVRLTSADGRLVFTLHVVPADAGFHQEAVDGYQRRHSELAAVVETKNRQAAQTPAEQAGQLNRWRRAYKTANGLKPFGPPPSLRLPQREDAAGLIPAEYDVGSWVTWRDGPDGQQVTGQVMSPGPGKDTWYVSTDRTGVTGEYHVLSRSGKKDTGYTYALNGAATDLRPVDGPPEQVPFEDLPPVDSVPAQPLTSYADHVPGKGLAVVREPIPVTVGEITPRGPELVFDVLADGVPFVVTVARHGFSGVQIFTPHIEIDGETVLTFRSAESRGGAVEICERVVREAREEAAKPLRARHRDYDFAPAAVGRCARYNLHADDAEPQPLYRVGDSDPLCIEHVVSIFGVEMSEVSKLARAHQIWGTRVVAEPAAAVPPADVEPTEGAVAQEKAGAAASQDPHEVACEALQGGNRITVVVSGRSIEWDGEAWGLPVPETATVTGTVYPGYRDYHQRTTLLDAVIRDQTGEEVTAADSVFIRQLPAQARLLPAEHREDLRPETRTVAQVRLGDLIADGGTRGETITELRFADGNRRGSVIAFSTRDVAKGTSNSFALNLTDKVRVVPRERRRPQDVAAVFGRHSSHDQVASEAQRTFDLHAAVMEVAGRVWPNGTGPQDELRALSEAIGAIDATARGADAYRANAAAMQTAAAAAAALFAATEDDLLNHYVGLDLHRLRQHLDAQAHRLSASAAHLDERAAAATSAKTSPAAERHGAEDQPASDRPTDRTKEGGSVDSRSTDTEQLGLFGDMPPDAPDDRTGADTDRSAGTDSAPAGGGGPQEPQSDAAATPPHPPAPTTAEASSETPAQASSGGEPQPAAQGADAAAPPAGGTDLVAAAHSIAPAPYWRIVGAETADQAAARFGGPERLHAFAARVQVVPAPSPLTATSADIWLDGRMIGRIADIADIGDSGPSDAAPLWNAEPVFGTGDRRLARFRSQEAALAELAVRALREGPPAPDRLTEAMTASFTEYLVRPAAGLPQLPEAMQADPTAVARHAELAAALEAFGQGRSRGTTIAEDLTTAHDSLLWLAAAQPDGDVRRDLHGRADMISVFLNVFRPEDPRAAQNRTAAAHETPAPADNQAAALAPDSAEAEPQEAEEQLDLFSAEAPAPAAQSQNGSAPEPAAPPGADGAPEEGRLGVYGHADRGECERCGTPDTDRYTLVWHWYGRDDFNADMAAECGPCTEATVGVPASHAARLADRAEAQRGGHRIQPQPPLHHDIVVRRTADNEWTSVHLPTGQRYRTARESASGHSGFVTRDLNGVSQGVAAGIPGLRPVVERAALGRTAESHPTSGDTMAYFGFREAVKQLVLHDGETLAPQEAGPRSSGPYDHGPRWDLAIGAATYVVEMVYQQGQPGDDGHRLAIQVLPEGPQVRFEQWDNVLRWAREDASSRAEQPVAPTLTTSAQASPDAGAELAAETPAPANDQMASDAPSAAAGRSTPVPDTDQQEQTVADRQEPPSSGEAAQDAAPAATTAPAAAVSASPGEQAPPPEPSNGAVYPASAPTTEDRTPATDTEGQMATPPHADTDGSVPVEDPPAPQPFTDITPLAADPAYQLCLFGQDGQGAETGELRRGDTTIAALHRSVTGQWSARLTVDNLLADVTPPADGPQDAADHAATLFSAFTGTPYRDQPTAATDNGLLAPADVLRTELRDAALRHHGAIMAAAERASVNNAQHPHLQQLSARLDAMARATADAHGSRQMAAHLTAVQQAVNAWGSALPADPALDERQHLAFPLAHLLYDTTRLRGRLHATLAALQAQQAAIGESADAATVERPAESLRDDRVVQEEPPTQPTPEPVRGPVIRISLRAGAEGQVIARVDTAERAQTLVFPDLAAADLPGLVLPATAELPMLNRAPHRADLLVSNGEVELALVLNLRRGPLGPVINHDGARRTLVGLVRDTLREAMAPTVDDVAAWLVHRAAEQDSLRQAAHTASLEAFRQEFARAADALIDGGSDHRWWTYTGQDGTRRSEVLALATPRAYEQLRATAAPADDSSPDLAEVSMGPQQTPGLDRAAREGAETAADTDTPPAVRPDGAAASESDGPDPDAVVDGIRRALDDALQASQPEAARPSGELPLWTGTQASPEDTATQPPGPLEVRAEFQAVIDAWTEHVPPENGTAQDLVADLDADLAALQRAFAEAITPPMPTALSATPDQTDTATKKPTEAKATAPVPQRAAAVNGALAQADTHTPALQDLPEWQKIQTVRGAVGHLVRVMKERAGEHFDRLMGDTRVGEFLRRVSIRACERIAQWAQEGADRLRRRGGGAEPDTPAAEALHNVADAAAAYSSPGGGRSGPPSASRDAAATTVDIPAMRKLGEALNRPMPGTGKRVSTAAARGRSTTTAKRAPKRPTGSEQAGHLRGGGPEQQATRKPNQR